jgi:predicted DNA-binding transcriptional regulator AlpA
MTYAAPPRRPESVEGVAERPLRLTEGPEVAKHLEPLLTALDVARILSVRTKRVYELGIPAVRISEKSLRWRRTDLEAWLDQRRVTS